MVLVIDPAWFSACLSAMSIPETSQSDLCDVTWSRIQTLLDASENEWYEKEIKDDSNVKHKLLRYVYFLLNQSIQLFRTMEA